MAGLINPGVIPPMPTYKNPGPLRFEAEIYQSDVVNSSAFIEFPFSVPDLFGVKGRVPVRATFDGIPYTGSLAKMGEGNHLLLILKEIREQLGKGRGDTIRVTLELDETPRTVEVPADLAQALAATPGADEKWAGLAFTHQKEYVRWVEEAKRPETRATRVAKVAEMVGQGKKPVR